MQLAITHSPVAATSAPKGEVVYVVDGDGWARDLLSESLSSRELTVKAFGTARDYITCRKIDSASCLILHIPLPDMNGSELQRRLAEENCPPIILISGRVEMATIVSAAKPGFIEILTGPVMPRAIEDAIESALSQDRERRLRSAKLHVVSTRYATLTPREREVFELVTGGLLNKQAAAVLGISDVTLQVHRCQVMRKMAAPSFAELVRMAEGLGVQEQLSIQSLINPLNEGKKCFPRAHRLAPAERKNDTQRRC